MQVNLGVTLNSIEILLQLIYSQYFSESFCISVISETSYNLDMIPTSKVHLDPRYCNKSILDFMVTASDLGCSDYFVQMANPEDFMKSFAFITRFGNLRRSDKKLIFLPTFTENNTAALLNILSTTEASYLANILLVIPAKSTTSCEVFDLVTHRYIGNDSKANEPIYLDQWDSCSKKFKKKANLFPYDMTNMMGKTVRVACFDYAPYTILGIDQSIEPLGRDGTEIRIIEEFCRTRNCSVELVGDDGGEWGELFDNGTGNGVIGKLARDEADIAISALYYWYDEYKVLDLSTFCLRTAITCITPAPRPLASWELPLLPFSWMMWLLLLCTFLYSSIALVIAQRMSTDKVFLTTFGAMVTQSQSDTHGQWRVRSITGWLLLAGLIIDNAYSSGLAATFTVPKYEKSIDTIQDIIDSDMTWGATHDAWVFSLVQSQDPKIMQLVRQFRVHSEEVLKQKSFTRSMAFSIERLQGGDHLPTYIMLQNNFCVPKGYFAIGDYITKEAVLDMELMLQDFYYEQSVVMLRKNSAYTEKINEFLGKLQASGLLLAWETQVALKYLDFKVQLEVKLSRSRRGAEIVRLSFRHLVGVFIIYLIGISVSMLFFTVEVLNGRRIRNLTFTESNDEVVHAGLWVHEL